MKRDIEAALDNDEVAEHVGKVIAQLLQLKPAQRGQEIFDTTHGPRSHRGLARVVATVMLDALHEKGVR